MELVLKLLLANMLLTKKLIVFRFTGETTGAKVFNFLRDTSGASNTPAGMFNTRITGDKDMHGDRQWHKDNTTWYNKLNPVTLRYGDLLIRSVPYGFTDKYKLVKENSHPQSERLKHLQMLRLPPKGTVHWLMMPWLSHDQAGHMTGDQLRQRGSPSFFLHLRLPCQ